MAGSMPCSICGERTYTYLVPIQLFEILSSIFFAVIRSGKSVKFEEKMLVKKITANVSWLIEYKTGLTEKH